MAKQAKDRKAIERVLMAIKREIKVTRKALDIAQDDVSSALCEVDAVVDTLGDAAGVVREAYDSIDNLGGTIADYDEKLENQMKDIDRRLAALKKK